VNKTKDEVAFKTCGIQADPKNRQPCDLNPDNPSTPSPHHARRRQTPPNAMADTHLTQEDLKSLDQTRHRIAQLASNIGALKKTLQESNPLPAW
jgi:hypothetical protein